MLTDCPYIIAWAKLSRPMTTFERSWGLIAGIWLRVYPVKLRSFYWGGRMGVSEGERVGYGY